VDHEIKGAYSTSEFDVIVGGDTNLFLPYFKPSLQRFQNN